MSMKNKIIIKNNAGTKKYRTSQLIRSKELRKIYTYIGRSDFVVNRAFYICNEVSNKKSKLSAIRAIGRMASLMQLCGGDYALHNELLRSKDKEYLAIKDVFENGINIENSKYTKNDHVL